jgi:hypothetical protein
MAEEPTVRGTNPCFTQDILNAIDNDEYEDLTWYERRWVDRTLSVDRVNLIYGSKARTQLFKVFANYPITYAALSALVADATH